MGRTGNYEIFRQEALKRFLTFDQEALIRRLGLDYDEEYIYVDYLRCHYRFSRKRPELELVEPDGTARAAGMNEALTLCDLLCHTTDPIVLTGDFLSLQSLNRVKSGTTQSTLASGMFRDVCQEFDGKDDALCAACEALGGIAAGKGDVAYEIPLFEPIHIRFSFYDSDDEFEPQITILFSSDICHYLHYETLYYIVGNLIERLKSLISQ